MVSGCGEIRSTAAVNSNAAREHHGRRDDPTFGDQPLADLLRVGAVERGQCRDGTGLVVRLDHPPPGHVGEIRPAFIHANIPPAPADSDIPMPEHERDEKNRMKLPAYLLAVHKGG